MEDAVQSIISTMKAFNIEAQNSMHIVDAFNEVGNNFAISSRGIGEALFRSSAALAATNNTFEQSIGLIVAANEVIQNPEIVGTALRTLSMRLTNTAGQLEELGYDSDGAAESITRLHAQLLNLTEGRVDIMASATEFKSTFDILYDLASIWHTLTGVQQAEVTRLVAGVRQGQVMAALMNGMSSAAAVAETALNSAGSAMRENETWLRSLEGRTALFNATFEATASSIIDSGFIKFFIDLGTAIVSIFGAFDGLIGQMVLIPAAIVSITGAAKAMGRTRLAGGVIDFFNNIRNMPAQLTAYGNALRQVAAIKKSSASSINEVAGSMDRLAFATLGMSQSQSDNLMNVSGLTAQQFATEGLTNAQVSQLASLTGLTEAQVKQQYVTKALTQKQIAQIAVQQKSVMMKELGISITKTSTAADLVSAQAKLKSQLITMGLSDAIATETANTMINTAARKTGIAATAGQTKANIGLKATFKGMIAGLKGVAVAWLATPMGKATLVIAAVAGIVAAHRAWSEAIEENNARLRERANTARNELNTLTELIASYRELRSATVFDESARSQVADIQERISDLVGDQARNLDLVNGALTEQLSLLHGIERTQAVAAREAMESAMLTAQQTSDRGAGHSSVQNLWTRWGAHGVGRTRTIVRALNRSDVSQMSSLAASIFEGAIENLDIVSAFNGLNTEDQIHVLEEWRRAFHRLGSDGANALGFVNATLEDLQRNFNQAQSYQRAWIDASIQASRHANDLTHNQLRFFREAFTNIELSGEDITDFIDTFANDTALRDALDNLFDRSHANQAAMQYRDTILGIIESLPSELRDLFEGMDSEDIALSLNFAISQESIDRMKDRINSVVLGNIDTALADFTMADLRLAYDIAFGADSLMTWNYLNAQMELTRLRFDNVTISADSFNDSISDLSRGLSLLSTASNELTSVGDLSVDTITALINELGDAHLDYFYVVNGQVRVDVEQLREHVVSSYYAMGEAIRNNISNQVRALEVLNDLRTEMSLIDTTDMNVGMWQIHMTAMEDVNRQIAEVQMTLDRYNQSLILHEATYQSLLREQHNYIETLGRMNSTLAVSHAAMAEMNESGRISFETFTRLAETIPNITDYISTINGQLVLNTAAWNQNEVATQLALQALQEYSASLPPWNERTQGQIQVMQYLFEQYERLRTGVLTAAEIMEQAIDTTDRLSSAYSSLTSAVDEFNKYGNVQIGTVQRLLAMGDEYLDLLEFSEGKLVLNTAAIDMKVKALREEMIASQQAALAEEIRAIIQEDTRIKTDELSNSTDHARERLIRIGRQALSTAEDFGVLTAAVQAANSMMLAGEHGDLSHLSAQAMANIEDAFRRHQRNIDIINSMAPTASANFPRGSTPNRSSGGSGSSGGGGDPWRDRANEEIANLRWQHDRRLISEEVFLNRLDALNQQFFAGRAQYLEEWRRLELEVVNGVRRVWEESLNLQLTRAGEFMDFDQRIELYRQFQQDLHAQANRFRGLGFSETSNEILELANRWQDFQNSIWAASRERLEVRLSIAQEELNFDEQLAIYREFQEVVLSEIRRFRYAGLAEDNLRIQQLEQNYRAYAARIVDVFNDKFRQEREAFDRNFSHLEFNLSLTQSTDYAGQQRLLNQQLENRLSLSGQLVDQMVRLRMQTDDTTRSTQAFMDLMRELESAYEANIRQIYELVNAHRQLAESQISDVRNLQEQVIAMLRARHQRERDLEREAHDQRRRRLDEERDMIRARYDAEIGYIDDLLRALQRQWQEEDRRRRRENDITDVNEIKRRINELRLAAATGDAEAISRIEDLKRQLENRQGQIADADERDRREDIRNQLNDRRDALRDSLDAEMAALDRRREILDAEHDAIQAMFDERLRNANLYAEARLILERGVNEQLIADLRAYEKEFGEGMGILGDYVLTRLTQQIWVADEALRNLAANVRIATDQDLFGRVMRGEGITMRDFFSEMFNTARLDEIINRINEAIQNIDIDHITNDMRILRDEFARLVNGNFDLSSRGPVTTEQMRAAGWRVDDGASTMLNNNFQVTDRQGQQLTIMVTPILENGRILTPEELQRYVNERIQGATDLLQADDRNLIIATAVGWDDNVFDDLTARLDHIQRQYSDLWQSMQDNIDKFIHMTDDGLFRFIQQQFGTIPDSARDAIAEALRELGSGRMDLEEALNTIFNLPVDNLNGILSSSLNSLAKDQMQAIEHTQQAAAAYEDAATEATRARLRAEEERLNMAQAWINDNQFGSWYLDEGKIQELFEVIEAVKNAQVDKIETLMGLYEDDYRKFDDAQRRKLLSARRLHDEVVRSNNEMFLFLAQNISRFVVSVESVLNQIGQAVHALTQQLHVMTHLAAEAQAQMRFSALGINASPNITTTTTSIPRFASGGLNRGAGLRFLDPNEQVLTAEQTRAFSDLVFGLGSDGMRNIADTIRRAGTANPNVQNRSLVEANFNFHAGVTQEALPEVQRMIGSAIHELKGEIPAIVATDQRDTIRRAGGR